MRVGTTCLTMALLGAIGCNGGAADKGQVLDSGDPDAEVALLPTDCTEDSAFAADLAVTETDVPTVFDVSWTTAEAVRTSVTYAVDAGEAYVTSWDDASTEHHHLVRGVPATTEVLFRAQDEGGACGVEQRHSTGALPSGLPLLTMEGDSSQEMGFTYLPVVMSDVNYLAVIDPKGRFVWAKEVGSTLPYRLEASLDGDSLLFISPANSDTTNGFIRELDWTGAVVNDFLLPGIHTDFAQADDGTLYALSWQIKEITYKGELRRILDDRLMEIDPETGEYEIIWSVYEEFPPDLDETFASPTYPDETVEDFAHLNGISVDEDNDAILVSGAGLNLVFGVDRTTGTLLWTAGQKEAVPGEDPNAQSPVDNPHSVFRRPDGQILVFNRNAFGNPESCSRAAVLDVNESTGESEISQLIEGEQCLSVYFLGQARPIEGNRTLVTWTTSGRVEIFDEAGASLWQVTADLGAGLTFTDHHPTLY